MAKRAVATKTAPKPAPKGVKEKADDVLGGPTKAAAPKPRAKVGSLDKDKFEAALNMVAPALSTTDKIEQLGCLWFDEATVSAFDNVMGMQVPLKSGLAGGIRGRMLIDFLAKCPDKELSATPNESGIKVEIGSAKVAIGLLKPDERVWAGDSPDPKKAVKLGKEFLTNLSDCMLSADGDKTMPDSLGVTVVANDETMDFYTTDRATITWTGCPRDGNWEPEHAVIPTAFCHQLVKLAKEGDLLEIRDDDIVASVGDGTVLYARLIKIEEPANFSRIIAATIPKDRDEHTFPIPAQLGPALQRALVLMSASPDQRTNITVAGKAMLLHSHGPLGEIREDIPLTKDVPKGKLVLSAPALLARGINHASHMLLGTGAMVMTSESGLVHMLAALRAD